MHQTSITYWEMKRPFPINCPQVYRSLLHQTSITYWEMRPYPVQMDPPLIEPKCTEHYYTKPVKPIEKWGDPPPLIDPNCTEPYYTKPVEPIEKWGGPPTNQTKVYRALLHQTSRTYWEMRRPSPTNWPQVYRALLHQTSMTYWEMRPYPVQMDAPFNKAQLYRALLNQDSITYWEMRRPSQTNWTRCTEPYYTKPVEPI